MSLLRALLGALAAGVLPGYPWAVLVRRCDGLTERLAYSAAISLASVPAVALLLTRFLGTGVTLQVALISVAAVAGSGALARRLWGAGDEKGPVLPRPAAI